MEPTGIIDASPARVVICGDYGIIRAALQSLLESDRGLVVVRQCEAKPDVLAAALRADPDLVLLDLDLCARCFGIRERIEALLEAANGIPVLILTAREDCQAAQTALERGAAGLVMKSRPPEVLHAAVRAAIAGQAWMERSAMAAVLRSVSAPEAGNDVLALTRREREIVDLVVLGMQNRAIAERLFIAQTTVRHHLTSVFDKLGVTNRFELIRKVFSTSSELQPVAAGVRG